MLYKEILNTKTHEKQGPDKEPENAVSGLARKMGLDVLALHQVLCLSHAFSLRE